MDIQNLENTLKKMGLILERVVKKVDELDKRLAKIEEKIGNDEKLGSDEKKFSSEDLKSNPQMNQTAQTPQNSASKSSLGGFGSSFLGSMAGAMAGMGLYNLLFNHSVSPEEFGKEIGMDENELNEALESNLDELESKLDELDSKIEELDAKLDELNNEDVLSGDYESFDEGLASDDFEGFDDIDGFDEV